MKILFVTTHNLSTNPRLVKEIDLALKNGYEVELICFEFNNWSYKINQQLKERFKTIKIHSINAGRKPFLPWFISIAAESVNRWVGKSFSLPIALLSQAVSRRSHMLVKALKNVKSADLVIGHNPGALYPTFVASKKFNCPAGFDVEDYHPGEGHNQYLQGLTRLLLTKLLPKMSYVSFAAPLILKETVTDIPGGHKNWFTILNYFPASEFLEPSNLSEDGPIKMVWFSQNIDEGRGLELMLPFMKKVSGKVELHLFGNLNARFYEEQLKDISSIIIHDPLTQIELHHQLEKFDIGLALDVPIDINRDLVLTNKLLTYLQAGLFVLASNTKAQESFLSDLPEHGLCFDYKNNNVEEVFEKIMVKIDTIRSNRLNRYKAMQNSNWETTSLSLLNVWQKSH